MMDKEKWAEAEKLEIGQRLQEQFGCALLWRIERVLNGFVYTFTINKDINSVFIPLC